MQGIRERYLRTHNVSNDMSPDLHVPRSYVVGDIYAADASPEAQAGVPAILQDVVDGEALSPLVGRLGPVDTHRVISQVLQTLSRLHKKGWVHRDLHLGQIMCTKKPSRPKPPRQLLTQRSMPDGSISDCVLVDFDTVVFLGNATSVLATYTVTGFDATGSKPPEYHAGRVTSTLDVWAVGTAMLAMRAASPMPTFAKDLHRGQDRRKSTFARMRAARPYKKLSNTEWAFIRRCLAFDWQQRPTPAILAEDRYILKGA
jgi:serine/threonine protein kinase